MGKRRNETWPETVNRGASMIFYFRLHRQELLEGATYWYLTVRWPGGEIPSWKLPGGEVAVGAFSPGQTVKVDMPAVEGTPVRVWITVAPKVYDSGVWEGPFYPQEGQVWAKNFATGRLGVETPLPWRPVLIGTGIAAVGVIAGTR